MDVVKPVAASVELVAVIVEVLTAESDGRVELKTSEPEDDCPEEVLEIPEEDVDGILVTVVDSPSDDAWVGNESRRY